MKLFDIAVVVPFYDVKKLENNLHKLRILIVHTQSCTVLFSFISHVLHHQKPDMIVI